MNLPQRSVSCLAALIGFFALTASPGISADLVRVIRTPNNGQVPDAETDKNGVIHIAYVSNLDAFYVSSTNDGTTFTTALRINSEPGSVHPPNMFRGPDLAIGKTGRVHVAWYVNAYQRKLPEHNWGVHYSHLDAGQTAFVKALNLNQKPSDNYSLAADDNGNVAVIWMKEKIFVNTSTNNGQTFFFAQNIPISTPCECCASRAYFSRDNTLYVAYRDKANDIRDMQLLTRAKMSGAFAKQKISSTPWLIKGCPMTGAFLTGSRNGLIIMAWETKGEISYTRIDPSSRFASPTEIKAAPKGKWPIALAAPDGTVLVSWKNGSALSWQLRDASDKPIGEAKTQPSRNTHRHAGVVTQDGSFLLID